MKIVMYVAGMTFNGNTIKEGKSLGGSESAGYYVARELAKLGHDVTMFSSIQPEESKFYEGVLYVPIGERSDKVPLGKTFMEYATNVPHDALIIQRLPNAFLHRFKSKINILWNHDLALHRSKGLMQAQLAQIDKVLAVSDWHKEQIKSVYDIQDRTIDVLPNGVDVEHYGYKIGKKDIEQKFKAKTLLFTSRPERGLENLVKPNGIMEKLLKLDPEIKLFVSSYSNVSPDMKDYYNYLWGRCNDLPNVEIKGFLGKQELAQVERKASMYVYPTTFEETSCITAMHSQYSGTPFIASPFGALPETLEDGGVVWVNPDDNDQIHCGLFAETIHAIFDDFDTYKTLVDKCKKKSKTYNWAKSAKKLDIILEEIFEAKTRNKVALAKHFLFNSDVSVAKKLAERHGLEDITHHINTTYPQFMSEQDYKEFYDNLATYHKRKGNNHALGDDTYHLGTNKMRVALNYIAKLPDGSNVLDLGCCVGSHTVALARLFPRLNFVGVDISKEQILIANDFAKYHNIGNVVFYDSETFDKEQVLKFNAVYCSEVLEHVVDYQAFAQKAVDYCKEEGLILFTVPSGPWEKKSDIKEHIHHFEYYDIVDVFAKQEEFFINYIPFNGELGHHVFGFRKNSNIKLGLIDFERKIKNQSPKETLSVCIITTNTVGSLEKTLKSVYEIADEIIVGVDSGDNSIDKGLSYLLEKYECDFFKIESPLVQGFDEARNATIQYATCDWVMWIDSDEIFNWPERLDFYLRNNNFDAYAIAQHHYSSEPAAKIKTDIPCRIFRNHQNITFYGVVHEHPEKVLNEGIKHVFIVPENHVSIAHNGYETEDIRRKRFQRNFPLMEKDREKYPTRTLGLFLWVRDLCHLNRFEFEKTGRHDQKAVERAREGLKIWRQFVKEGKTRFVIDLLEYVNEFSQLLTQGGAIQVSFGLNVNQIGIGDQMQQLQPINAFLETKEDVEEITRMVIQHKLDIIPEKYL